MKNWFWFFILFFIFYYLFYFLFILHTMCFYPVSLQKLGMVLFGTIYIQIVGLPRWLRFILCILLVFLVVWDSCSLSFPSQFLGKRPVGIWRFEPRTTREGKYVYKDTRDDGKSMNHKIGWESRAPFWKQKPLPLLLCN